MTDNFSHGIAIDRINIKISDFKTAQQYEDAKQSHRDKGHTFHIVEKGTVIIEIDFNKYEVAAPVVVYMHPDQVHRILDFDNITVCTLAITNEQLHPDYLTLLETIAPAKPLVLTKEIFLIVSEITSLCLKFSLQNNNHLYHHLLKDSSNALVAFLISQFLGQNQVEGKISRTEIVTKSFKKLVEKNYGTLKRPGDYAKLLHISAPYLNECVKNATGFSVSQYIQERILLEAKRLLYHTDKSVKEISYDLGYVDYPYFTRLFAKATGMSALAFRSKNHE